MKSIKRLVYLTLETPKFDEMVKFYSEKFGLSAVDRGIDYVTLGGVDGRPMLRLQSSTEHCLSELAFAVTSNDFADVRAELSAGGYEIGTEPNGSFFVHDPSGRKIIFVVEDGYVPASPAPDGKPLFVSHVVINSKDPARLVSFFVDVLGFSISDEYERKLLTFLRCSQPQHHCLGISPGDQEGLNHFSVDCGSIDGVMKNIGRLKKEGVEPIWGPGRHGPGGNIFCYYEDPAGFVPEFTCDVLQIVDDSTWDAKVWPRTPDTANVWGTGGPTPRAVELMSGNARKA